MVKLFTNSGDPVQTPHSAASDLGLHCLSITLLRISWLQWVKPPKWFLCFHSLLMYVLVVVYVAFVLSLFFSSSLLLLIRKAALHDSGIFWVSSVLHIFFMSHTRSKLCECDTIFALSTGQTDPSKQCRLRSDVAKCSIWLGLHCLPLMQQFSDRSTGSKWSSNFRTRLSMVRSEGVS